MRTAGWLGSRGCVVLVICLLLAGALPSAAEVPQQQRVKPGDVLEITVMGQADLTRSVTIRPDGRITYPFLGELTVAGLTIAEVGQLVTTGLKTYLKDPLVTVTLVRMEPEFIHLMGGGIVRPGTYEVRPGWTVLDALLAGGGLAPRAALTRGVLIRRGQTEPIVLDLQRLMLGGDQAANLAVEPGDVILVPLLQLRALVLGSVRSPGFYDLDNGARVLDAVMQAGGPADRASWDQIGLIRQKTDGSLTVTPVSLLAIVRRGDQSQNHAIRHGDILFVPEQRRIDWASVLAWIAGLRTVFGSGFLLFGP